MAGTPAAAAADIALVWGNCQAGPLADLLRGPLAEAGLRVVELPPVYLASAQDVRRLHGLARRCALLVSQPVRDEYDQPGCGTEQLITLLPPHAAVVRCPIVYDSGPFPFQVRGYDGDGRRVDAPLTDYHDLRIVQAAAAGLSTPRVIDEWSPPTEQAWRAVAASSLAELRRREVGQDVIVSDLVRLPGALWTMSHPSNKLLAELAGRVLARIDVPGRVDAPAREYLGQRRAPVDADTARLLGWAGTDARPHWVIDGQVVPPAELVERQLTFYRARPDVVTRTIEANAARVRLLADDASAPPVDAPPGRQPGAAVTRP